MTILDELANCLLFFERLNTEGNLMPWPVMAWDTTHVWGNIQFSQKFRPPHTISTSAISNFGYWKDGYARSFDSVVWDYADARITTIQGKFVVSYDPGTRGTPYVWNSADAPEGYIDIDCEL